MPYMNTFDETNDIFMYLMETKDRPPNLPEIIDQVWVCSYQGERFGYLFTTVYGYTNSAEGINYAVPEEWAHWQSKEAALFRLLDTLEQNGELPESIRQFRDNWVIDTVINGSENEDELDRQTNLIADIVKGFDAAMGDIGQFAENERVHLQTAKQFMDALKRKVVRRLLEEMEAGEMDGWEEDRE